MICQYLLIQLKIIIIRLFAEGAGVFPKHPLASVYLIQWRVEQALWGKNTKRPKQKALLTALVPAEKGSCQRAMASRDEARNKPAQKGRDKVFWRSLVVLVRCIAKSSKMLSNRSTPFLSFSSHRFVYCMMLHSFFSLLVASSRMRLVQKDLRCLAESRNTTEYQKHQLVFFPTNSAFHTIYYPVPRPQNELAHRGQSLGRLIRT